MKHLLLLSVLSIGLFTGCSTAFKAGQTPDDVYYSPGREIASVNEEKKQQKEKEEYQEYISSLDDRYLRMKVAKRGRWSSLDNFDYCTIAVTISALTIIIATSTHMHPGIQDGI